MREAVGVSQVNAYIQRMFQSDRALTGILVEGEIGSCKYHSTGIYFTLKDAKSQISCMMFRSDQAGLDFRLEEGQKVVITGDIKVFLRDGKYQLYAKRIQRDGTGRLYEEYEKRKKRLLEEGLFEQNRKKQIPPYATKIGVVTAQTGAVIQDICNVAHRRNPYVQIVLFPSSVQGAGAAREVIRGIHYFENSDVDTIIIGRGGGSLEDLWEFNDEELARAVAACTKPIISAVGHETDVALTDYVADLRAPTPSAAAELAVFSYADFQDEIQELRYQFNMAMENQLHHKKMLLSSYELKLKNLGPVGQLKQKRQHLSSVKENLRMLMQQNLERARHRLALQAGELKGLSPLNKLQGGYAYVERPEGGSIHSVEELESGQNLLMNFEDGRAKVTVNTVEPGGLNGR